MKNSKKLKEYIKSLKYGIGDKSWLDEKENWLIHLCNSNYDEKQTLELIELLLNKTNIDINIVDEDGYNLLQNALYSNYSQEFMIELFKIVRNHGGFDINYNGDPYGDTVMHTALESDNYIGKVAPLMEIACEMGFDPNIKNKKNKTVLDVALNPDSDYELDEEDLFEVERLIEEQKTKIRLVGLKKQLDDILEQLPEKYRYQILEETCKKYIKTK